MAEELELPEQIKTQCDAEVKKPKKEVACLVKEEPNIERVIDPSRYSTLQRLLTLH